MRVFVICLALASSGLADDIPSKLTQDAVRALVADPGFKDYQGLTKAIGRSPERDFRIWAYQHIAEKGKIEAFNAYYAAYEKEGNLIVKSVLLSSLGRLGTITHRIENWNGVGNPNVPLLDDGRRIKLVALMKDAARPGSPEILRVSAIHRIGELRLGDQAEFLASATRDPSPAIRQAALGSIRFVGNADFWLKELKEGSPELKRLAIDAVGGQDDPALDKPLEEIANAPDDSLASAARTHLRNRAQRRKVQRRLEGALYPTPVMIGLSAMTKVALSNGWYAVWLLIVPCALAAWWALANKEFQTLGAASFFLFSLVVGFIAMKTKASFAPGSQLLVVLVGAGVTLVPVLTGLVMLRSKAVIFDLTMVAGAAMMGCVALFREEAMRLFLLSGLVFGVAIVYGSVQAAVAIGQGRPSEAAHCVAYASVLALLLGCMPFAFIGM